MVPSGPNPEAATISATDAECFPIGGDFQVMLWDLRPYDRSGTIDHVSYEVGKFRLTLYAFLKLERHIRNARAKQELVFGEMPSLEKLENMFKTFGDMEAVANEYGQVDAK